MGAMETFDDIESTNARLWDEETPGCYPPGATVQLVSRPRRYNNETRQVSLRQVPGSINESPRTIPGRPILNTGAKPKCKPDLAPWKNQGHKQPGRSARGRIVKRVEWAKQNAVNTKRKQDHLDREAKEAAKSVKFLSPPEEDNFPVEGYYLWTDNNSNPSSLLGDNLQLLDDIRSNCEVYIDFVETLGYIRLRSKARHNIENGVAAIKAKIHLARSDAAALAPIIIVEPPAVHAMRFKVSPRIRESHHMEKKSTAMRAVLSGSTLTPEQRAAYEIDRELTRSQNQERVFGRMVTALVGLGSLNKPMRMRSNIGEILLLQVRKEFKEGGYRFRAFTSMIEEPRTTTKFRRIIGEAAFTGRILELFRTGSSLLEPTDSLKSRLADVEAKHSLEVIAHGSSKQSVRIEADIDMVQGGLQENIRKRNATWQLGAIRYYEYRHGACKTRLTIGILNIECNFDSCLEVVTEEMMLQPIKAFQTLIACSSILRTSTFATGKLSFRFPVIRLSVCQGITVGRVRVRSSFQYRLRNTPYIVEVAVYHDWNNGETKQEPLTSCGISLYHKDWDLLMTPDEGIEAPRSLDVHSLFPNESGFDDGLSTFFAHVQTLQRFVNPV